jgi:hypothetical protein
MNVILTNIVCDPAGVGFDNPFVRLNPKSAAKNVQCIHTSSDKGTFKVL